MSEDIKIYEVNKITEGESIFNEDGSLTVTLHIQDEMRGFIEEMVFSERDQRTRRTQRNFDKSTWLLRIIKDLYENRNLKYKPNPISVETVEMINDLFGQQINMNIELGFIELREQLNNIEGILRCLVDDADNEDEE
jgi:hypothetical protein